MQVSRQESEPFTGFNSRPGKNNAVDFFCAKRGNRCRNGQIRFSSTCRAFAYRYGIGSDCITIKLLAYRFRFDRFPVCGNADHITNKFLYFILSPLLYQTQDIANILVADVLPFCCERKKTCNCLLSQHYIFRLAANVQCIFPIENFYAKLSFQNS